MKKILERIKPAWNTMKNTVKLFIDHDTFTLGAALSYYMVFSIGPVLIIVISIAGAILGPDAVTGQIKQQIQGLLGPSVATQIQEIVKAAYNPNGKVFVTIVAIVFLVIGATSVFGQMRTSLNTIWDVKPKAKQAILQFLIERFFSFAMILCITFLMLVTLVVHAGLAAFSGFLGNRLPGLSVFLIQVLEICLSFGITTMLFGLIYKFLSDARLLWTNVWQGGLFTAMLFAIGKYGIGLYVAKANLTSTYGAASSIILLLVWVFYSSQILFIGAAFTRALAAQKGQSLDPNAISAKHDAVLQSNAQAPVSPA